MSVSARWLRWGFAAALAIGASFAAEAQEIRFWILTFDNPNVTTAFDKIVKDFEASNPGDPELERQAHGGLAARVGQADRQ
jgi:ABC-type glycerol-3-phosphate transport system substrate-binding protein